MRTDTCIATGPRLWHISDTHYMYSISSIPIAPTLWRAARDAGRFEADLRLQTGKQWGESKAVAAFDVHTLFHNALQSALQSRAGVAASSHLCMLHVCE